MLATPILIRTPLEIAEQIRQLLERDDRGLFLRATECSSSDDMLRITKVEGRRGKTGEVVIRVFLGRRIADKFTINPESIELLGQTDSLLAYFDHKKISLLTLRPAPTQISIY